MIKSKPDNHSPDLLAYLHRDPLKHIVHLKMLSAYGSHIQSRYITSDGAAGVLFLLPTRVTSYDLVTYPNTEFVILIITDSPAISEKLMAFIPTEVSLIFKFIARHDRTIIAKQFPLTRVISFLSYTSPQGAQFSQAQEVAILTQFDERLMPLFYENAYTSAEIAGHFNTDHALAFAIFEHDQPVSACLAYQNYGQVWEIGMLYTVEQARRKGYAQKIVGTALNVLLANGRIPRYQMAETNIASQNLAIRIGMTQFLSTDHYLYEPTSS